jgi:hypothetical protein
LDAVRYKRPSLPEKAIGRRKEKVLGWKLDIDKAS